MLLKSVKYTVLNEQVINYYTDILPSLSLFIPRRLSVYLTSFSLCSSFVLISVTRKKSPNFYKSCPKMIDFDTFTKIA